MTHTNTAHQLTPEIADAWLRLAIDNIQIEYPHMAWIVANSSDDYALHRELHPTFFGSFDWHSCVEMYWVAARILHLFPGLPTEREAVALIDDLLTPANIARETAFCHDHPGFERPYGWGWALKLQHELDISSRPEAARWGEALRPLSGQLASQFSNWLPKLTYAQRMGMHGNTAFGLTLALPYVEAAAPDLQGLIGNRVMDWFGTDANYPFAYEPSGADFLSAGLCEAVLMQRLMDPDVFTSWADGFLPNPGSEWLVPAIVSDPTDGQIAHLHGLNLSRAWALGELADVLSDRTDELLTMREAHLAASIDVVAGSHYMVEHWVVAYALLLFTEP